MKRQYRFETLEGRRLMTGATQISGVATLPGEGQCEVAPDAPDGTVLGFTMKMEGDLEGCFYSFVATAESSPSGTYRERGIDIYVGSGEDGDTGTFATTYFFTAKYDEAFNEIWGRCQHPITAGTGTGDFEGVTGRLDFRDNVEDVTFPYKGHLRNVKSNAADALFESGLDESDVIQVELNEVLSSIED